MLEKNVKEITLNSNTRDGL